MTYNIYSHLQTLSEGIFIPAGDALSALQTIRLMGYTGVLSIILILTVIIMFKQNYT